MTSAGPEIIDLTVDSPGPSSSKLAVNGSLDEGLKHSREKGSDTPKPLITGGAEAGAKLSSVIVISDDDSSGNDQLYHKRLHLSETLVQESTTERQQASPVSGQPPSSRRKKKRRGKEDSRLGKSRDYSTNGEMGGLFFIDDQPMPLSTTDRLPDISDANNISLNADDPANSSGLLLPEHVIVSSTPNGVNGVLNTEDTSALEEDDFIRYLDYDDDTQRVREIILSEHFN